MGRNASPNVPSPVIVCAGGIRGEQAVETGQILCWKKHLLLLRLQTKYWPRLLFSPLRASLILVDKTSSYWRGELYHRLLQDKKSLNLGQSSFLTQRAAFGNPTGAAVHPLSREVGGWKGLRRRSQMGNNFVFPQSPARLSNGVASAAGLFLSAARNLDYPAVFTSSTLLLVTW